MDKVDLVVAGTGFASSFFLHRFLQDAGDVRVRVLEAGPRVPHGELVAHARRKVRRTIERYVRPGPFPNDRYVNRTPHKPWLFTTAFGGGSNCWWACTPRMLPEDFALASTWGQGVDWPVSYDELEPWYAEAEALMAVSGPPDGPFPRSTPYPQPPHLLTPADRVLKEAHPRGFFVQPTARARLAVGRRPACCGNAHCDLCPIDAKFTIENSLAAVYDDPRVQLDLGCAVQAVEVEGGRATGVRFQRGGREERLGADLVVLGTNAIFNPHILLRSGLDDGVVGRGLQEQVGVTATVFLDGVDHFGGSTAITGHGYTSYAGAHRRERAACLIETSNRARLRLEPGKWRQWMLLTLIYEDLRRDDNRVTVSADDPTRPEVVYRGPSDYARAGTAQALQDVETLVAPLPVERIEVHGERDTEAHVMGTHVMGDDPATSVTDSYGRHHRAQGLVVLGSGSFPTAAPANPTLTLSALALRAADRLVGSTA